MFYLAERCFMRVFLPMIGFMLIFGANLGHAQQYVQGPYIGLSAGYLSLSDLDRDLGGTDVDYVFDDGFDVGVQLGYKQWIWRFETEFEYGQSGFQSIEAPGSTTAIDGDFDIYRWTGSIYYDFDNLSRFTPYFGGGLGAAYIDFDDASGAITGEGSSETYFTTHGEAGLSIALNDQFAVVPAYRYLWLNSGGAGFDDNTAHLFKLGARYNF